jgi:chromosome segregation ATPase
VILDGEVAMLQAQVERLQEQLTESDHDRIANISRLTGQVAELKAKLERQQAHHMDSRQELQEELSKSDAQRDELQRMLTACEEEKEAQRVERTELFYDCETAENRVRVLEGALRTAKLNMKPNAIWALDKVDAALAPTPPAETPAHWRVFIPTTDRERMGAELYERIAGHVSRLESENDRLRADLADTRAQLDKVRHDCDEMIKTFDEVEAQRDAEESAHAATKAQLGRAVAALRLAQGFMVEHGPQSVTAAHTAVADVLADADSKEAGDARRGGGRVCSTCNDTHLMSLGDDEVMCTRCPRPCQKCRAGGNGAYCSTTPCACDCHGGDS